MCGGGGLLKTIAEVGLPIAGAAFGPEVFGLGGLLGTGLGASGAGALGGALGGVGGSLIGGQNPLLGAAEGGLGGFLGNGGLSQLSDATGLSSLFGGTPQPTSDLASLNLGAGASPETAASATNPVNFASGGPSASYTAGASAGSAGAGGGYLGAPNTLSSVGETSALPSASGVGGAPLPWETPLADTSLSTPNLNSAGVGGTAPSGIGNSISNLFSPSNTGQFNFDVSGNPAGASSYTAGQQLANAGSSAITPSTGGNVSGLSSLFSGNSGSPVNGLLNSGLGYLLNNPNQKGANQISGAANAAAANYQPYLQAGQGAENTLANLYGNNGQAAQNTAYQNFQNTPGYQFSLGQGLNAINANNAATGQTLSGNALEGINNYAQGTASQQYNNYVNQLQNLASGGMSAAGGIGSNLLTGAGAQAGAGQNRANAQNTAIGTGLNSLFPTGQLNLQQLLGSLGGGGGSGQQGILNGLSSLFPSSVS